MVYLKEPSKKWGVSRRFGNGHNGIDYKFPANTPVYAAADGIVSFEGYGAQHSWILWFGGITILLRHKDIYTGYSHLNRTVVNNGQQVKQGQLIGYSGSTGNSTGPHLHFDVLPLKPRWGGIYSGRINPDPYFIKPKKYATTTSVANVRKQPRLAAPLSGSRQLKAGVRFDYVAIVTGDMVAGNNKWYKSSAGNYVWSGNIK